MGFSIARTYTVTVCFENRVHAIKFLRTFVFENLSDCVKAYDLIADGRFVLDKVSASQILLMKESINPLTATLTYSAKW